MDVDRRPCSGTVARMAAGAATAASCCWIRRSGEELLDGVVLDRVAFEQLLRFALGVIHRLILHRARGVVAGAETSPATRTWRTFNPTRACWTLRLFS